MGVGDRVWLVHSQAVVSDRRTPKLEDGRVTFCYRATETGKLKTCTLAVEEFMRRFLQHALPCYRPDSLTAIRGITAD